MKIIFAGRDAVARGLGRLLKLLKHNARGLETCVHLMRRNEACRFPKTGGHQDANGTGTCT
ncbi:hypothetical protein HYPGJ_10188 [Hyphomicrobium sp. GJ21]|nr:hypothetical protein HYPGJ_10188 [Hyphomicrobium sp. GJ21]